MTDHEIRAQAARRAFWTRHPLIDAYRRAYGVYDVPLSGLIAFTQRLPNDQFAGCMLGAGVVSDLRVRS